MNIIQLTIYVELVNEKINILFLNGSLINKKNTSFGFDFKTSMSVWVEISDLPKYLFILSYLKQIIFFRLYFQGKI